jgi:hypothetical protein
MRGIEFVGSSSKGGRSAYSDRQIRAGAVGSMLWEKPTSRFDQKRANFLWGAIQEFTL